MDTSIDCYVDGGLAISRTVASGSRLGEVGLIVQSTSEWPADARFDNYYVSGPTVVFTPTPTPQPAAKCS